MEGLKAMMGGRLAKSRFVEFILLEQDILKQWWFAAFLKHVTNAVVFGIYPHEK